MYICYMIKEEGKYFLYRHIRVDTNEVFYIGVGTKYIDQRTGKKHCNVYRRACLKALRNPFWKNIVAKTKYDIEIVCESDSYEFIEEKEKEFIQIYGRREFKTGTLCNMTDGGKGQRMVFLKSHSDETRKKMSESAKGRKFTEEHKRKLSEAKRNNPFLKGRKFSEEHKQKIRDGKRRNKICQVDIANSS